MSKLDKLFTKENIRILKEYKEMVGGSSNVYEKIIQWFIKNPNPPDSKVHALADQFGADHDKFESHIYKILSDLIHKGRSKNFKGKYDPKELAMGIEVEKEHMTSCMKVVSKIALDHLAELPNYYTLLKQMESDAGIDEATRLN